jgi:hypothetical protein
MAYPLSDRFEPKPPSSVQEIVLSQLKGDWVERLNVEQMFILIDGVLPFEACLYYQVLPLFIEGSRLNLGMVSPEDTSALDYVRRITSYLHYSLMPRSITSEALQAVLSAYLHHAGTLRSALQKSPSSRPVRGSARARAEQQIDRNTQPTLVVDSPEDLNQERLEDLVLPDEAPPPPPLSFPPTQPPEAVLPTDAAAIEAQLDPAQPEPIDREAVTLPPEAVTAPASIEAQPGEPQSVEPPSIPPLIAPLPPLEVKAKHLSNPVEVLATLPPKDLLQELLGRVLLGGIGRLYFERQPECGRVLWSQNGVLQSVLERLEPDQFQGLINELKRVTHLPLLKIQKPKQVEIERLYQNTRLLLRFRVMLSATGEEEATLQVLRGAALKFYQQQQLASLERDALTIARQLQLKVNEIRDRARSDFGLARKLDTLPALNQMLRYIEEQLEDLQSHPDSP